MRKFGSLLIVFALSLAAFQARSGETGAWPYGKTITLTVAYGAGGDSDLSVRYLAEYLSKEIGVNVVVTNISGGNGSIAMYEIVEKNDPNTYLVINTASLSANVVTGLSELSYKDMDVVSVYGRYSGETLYVPSSSPINSLEEFLDYAKKNRLTMGIVTGGALYSACRALMADGGLNLNLVDAGDGMERIVQVANNNLEATFASYTQGREYIASGHVKQLATLMADRLKVAPDMPSVSEYVPSAIVNTLFVILSPKGANSEADLNAFSDAVMRVWKNHPKYTELMEKLFYQDAKPMTRAESIVELGKQYEQFQKYAPYLK